jgi:hypothetical protein
LELEDALDDRNSSQRKPAITRKPIVWCPRQPPLVTTHHVYVPERGFSPWRACPIPMQPVVQARLCVCAQNAVGFVFQKPFDPREKLVVEAGIGKSTIDVLLTVNPPRLGKNHEIQLPDHLLVFGSIAPADAGHRPVGADECKPPVGGDY